MSQPETRLNKSIVVNAPIDKAFKVFTEGFDRWWPRSHKIGKAEMKAAVLECREGGRWYERGADGTECDWGRVLVYAPPARVSLSWHLDCSYTYNPDPAKSSRVDVTFHDLGGGKTRVDLVHSELDRHGAGWEKVRDSVGSEGGWSGCLALFAGALAA
jgi:uncharacterized protein YndB with AHSA1/START domain